MIIELPYSRTSKLWARSLDGAGGIEVVEYGQSTITVDLSNCEHRLAIYEDARKRFGAERIEV